MNRTYCSASRYVHSFMNVAKCRTLPANLLERFSSKPTTLAVYCNLTTSAVRAHDNHDSSKNEIRKPNTPKGKFDDQDSKNKKVNSDEAEKKDPYAPFPDNVNPVSGEIGGPRGPEPTRYGDWERKGRVSDF